VLLTASPYRNVYDDDDDDDGDFSPARICVYCSADGTADDKYFLVRN